MHYAGLRATLADALGKVGEVSRGLATIDEALARSERDEERWYVAEFLRIRGELLRLKNTPKTTKEAEEAISPLARLGPAAASPVVGIADVHQLGAVTPGTRTDRRGP